MGNKLQQEWGNWLKQWQWDWYVTLTFKYSVTSRQAHKAWKKFIYGLEAEVKGKVHYFRVSEQQYSRGDITHYHALLKGVKNQNTRTWEHYWFQIGGLAKIVQYKPESGAAFYICKHINRVNTDFIFSKHLDRVKEDSTEEY